ncbi:hypothetical protein CDD83_3607 [Cordyceps sp. RAO-2017]|nr:hypothetical protein CDD83_3607 [Cordyceps sp. RAO-2017]
MRARGSRLRSLLVPRSRGRLLADAQGVRPGPLSGSLTDNNNSHDTDRDQQAVVSGVAGVPFLPHSQRRPARVFSPPAPLHIAASSGIGIITSTDHHRHRHRPPRFIPRLATSPPSCASLPRPAASSPAVLCAVVGRGP